MLVQVFIVFFGTTVRTRCVSTICGTIALVINSSAYAEIIRAGINAVDRDKQKQRSLGFKL